MIVTRRSLRLTLVVVLSVFVQLAGSVAPKPSIAADPGVIQGSYIVVYRDDIVAAADVTELADLQPGVEITQTYQYALDGFAADLTPSALAKLQADPRVASIIPDRKMYPFAQTLTPGANRVDADINPYADIDGVDERVDADIAILDMGVGSHTDINVVGGYDCTGQNTILDNGGHGTHVAGIAAAKDNSTGIVGVAPGARVWSIKVLDAYDGNWSWVICGIDWVTAHADVIEVANMSLGENLGSSNQVFDGPMHQAIQRSVAVGVTYVVAAGNGSDDASSVIPAKYSEVITVSAIGDSDGKPGGHGPALSAGGDDRFANFSSYGRVVDIAAPGVDTYSTAPGGGFSRMSGTSFATPHVTGAVALYIGQYGRVGPAAVRAALLGTADPGKIPGDPDSYAEGVLNVGRFGGGTIQLSATSGKPGDKITATMSGFPANSNLSLSWDGKSFDSVTSNGNGSATRQFTLSAMSKGNHVFATRAGAKFGAVSFAVNPVIRLTPTAGFLGTEVKVVLRGFGSKEKIDILWKNGSRTTVVANVTASTAGSADAYFTAAASLGGTHSITADGKAGTRLTVNFTILPRIAPSPKSAAPEAIVAISLRGFQSRELVELRLVTSAGTTVLSSESVSSESGSRNATIRIPATSPEGTATLQAVGNKGTFVTAPFTVKPPIGIAEVSTPVPTESVEPTAAPSETPVADGSPIVETPLVTMAPTLESPIETREPEPTGTVEDNAGLSISNSGHSSGSNSGRIVSDGVLDTSWVQTGRSREPYLRLDLGEIVTIGTIRWYLTGKASIDGIELQVSTDRRNWATLDIEESAVGWNEFDSTGLEVRYLRFIFASTDGKEPVGGLAEVVILP